MQKIRKLLAILVLALLIGSGAYYAGFERGAAVRSVNITDSKQILNGDFSLFWRAVDLLKQNYVGIKDIKDQDILYGAIAGATDAMGDPYTTFFNPPDAKKFEQDIQGSFGGIGAEIGEKDGQVVIVAPLKGNPAEKAGLKASDKILKIDDTVTTGMATEEAIKLIRGEPGTAVKFLIMREGWPESKEFSVTRAVISVPTLDWEMRPGNIAYVQLYNFNANASSLFYQAALSALTQGARGMIIDLRNNPGGYLDVATNIAGWFLDRGSVIVVERFQSGEETRTRASGNAALAKMPVVVLVNGGSASASEILAGALRDDRRIKLVGEKTFGKGSVQQVEMLEDGSSLKISIAEWLTPLGSHINKVGLSPDIEIKFPDESRDTIGKVDKDPQYAKALEVLREEVNY